MNDDLKSLISDLKEKETLAAVKRALGEGRDPMEMVEGLREGISVVGRRFEEGEYFFSEMLMSAEIFTRAVALISPHLQAGDLGTGVRVVIGTVKGDIHDIGKNIVATLMRCNGFEVYDLGVDVPPDLFVAQLEETGAPFLALSGLMTFAFDSMKSTIELLAGEGLRDRVRVLIGGAPVDERVVDYTGADAYGKDASQAVRLVNSFLVNGGA